jgi:hypothetical protein
METTGINNTGEGIGKSTAEMKTQSTYEGWDFEDIWYIANTVNNDYPILKKQISIENTFISYIQSRPYTGSAIEPDFTLKFNEAPLAKNTDYTVSYSNNRNAGTAKVTVIGKGIYLGSIEAYFEITAKPLTITGVTALDKEYDGTTIVELAGGVLNGKVSGDVVSFTLGNGTVASASVGDNKAVSTNIALTGTGASNYTLTQPTDITVSISEATPISHPQIATGNIHVHTTLNTILLENLPVGAKVEVYNLQGKQLHSIHSENSKILRIQVQTKGIYVIKAGTQTMRVAVR